MSVSPAPAGESWPQCPNCAAAGVTWIVAPGRDLRRCTRCRCAWIVQGVARTDSGRTIYEDSAPVFFDDTQADYYRDETAVDAARAKLTWVRRTVPDGAALLDVGANFGLFVREAAAVYAAVGIEPSPTVVEWARREIGAPLEVGSIDDELSRFHGRFDAVTLFDVIEHLPDPDRVFARCRACLRPGGHLFVTTPDIGSLMARALGRAWYYIDMAEHVALFDRTAIAAILDRAGFEVLEMRAIGRTYRGSYIERRLAYLGRQSAALRLAHIAALPLRLVPAARVPINLGDVMAVVARRR